MNNHSSIKLFSGFRIACGLLAFVMVCTIAKADEADDELYELMKICTADDQKFSANAEQAIRDAKQAGNEQAELKAIVHLSFCARRKLSGSGKELERGMLLARKFNDLSAQCWLLTREAVDKEQYGGNAITPLFDTADAFAERHHFQGCRRLIFFSKAYMFRRQGRNADAMNWYWKYYEMAKEKNDKLDMTIVLFQIASLLSSPESDVQDLPKAIEYFQRGFALVDPVENRTVVSLYYLGMGRIHYRLEKFTEAKVYLEQALKITTETGDTDSAAGIKYHLGEVAKGERHFTEALDYLDDALRVLPHAVDRVDPIWLVQALVARAEVLAQLGRTDECQKTLAKAESALRLADSLKVNVIYYRRAAAVFAQMGNYAEAYRQMDLLWKANERFTSAAKTKLTDELKVRFDVQLKEAENALLRVEQQEANTRRVALLLASALGLLLLGGLALSLRRRAAVARMETQHHIALAAASVAANKAKSVFLANMSHELRSPLNAMLGFSRLLTRDPTLPLSARNDLAIVLNSGEHLYALINQVLDLSKIEAGKTTLQEKTLDVYKLIDELTDIFALTARDKGVQFIVDCHPNVPHYIQVDAVKLRQVLINLLSNAFKFTAHGSVTLAASFTATAGDAEGPGNTGRLGFSVNDSGHGVAADELEKLGEAFVQAQSGQKAQEGTGLGLAISRSFVQLMGGELRLASELGKGTSATFTITVSCVDDTEVKIETGSVRQVIGLAPGQPPYRILAVDDRVEGRQLLDRLLAPLGFEVRQACNGMEAIALWESFDPHLIWMDMRMPVMDGKEATRRIKATEKGKKTIVVALTASSFEEEREEIQAIGCDDFLRKPFQEDVLFHIMSKHLGAEFIYEEISSTKPATTSGTTFSDISLPNELSAELKDAISRLDSDAINRVIEAMSHHDKAFAETLAALAKNFNYGRILTLLEKVKYSSVEQNNSV